MKNKNLILASGSPRRRQLLELIGIGFEVIPADIDETPQPGEDPTAFARRAAREKAYDVAQRFPGRIILAADTVVEIDSAILGKPRSGEDAAGMLQRLSGRTHLVHTALAIVVGRRCRDLVDSARVQFVELSNEMIQWYVATEEPMDKAGAYGVQGIGGIFVAGVEGSPNTVIGLPLHRLPELFAANNLEFWNRLKEL